MADELSTATVSDARNGRGSRRRLRGLLAILMGVAAMSAIFVPGGLALLVVASLLILNGGLELFETFQESDEETQSSAYLSGEVSIFAGILLMAEPKLVLRFLSFVIAAIFFLDGMSKIAGAWRLRAIGVRSYWRVAYGLVNILIAFVLFFRWPVSGLGGVVILAGFRMVTTGWSILHGRTDRLIPIGRQASAGGHPDSRLGLPPHPEFERLEELLRAEDKRRWSIDLYWCLSLILIFFAIHMGRMRVEWNLVGLISPFVAVIGDIATALIVAFALILPWQLSWRKLTRPIERREWRQLLPKLDENRPLGHFEKLGLAWLRRRARIAHRLRQAASTPTSALRWGVQAGLPITAILIAINPMWGFSWFFNSESWATEVWNRWAEARTDTWRTVMISSVHDAYRGSNVSGKQLFQVRPDIPAGQDFSFLVLGDTGEGDASQLCLKDRILELGSRPDVRFLVISSDVIYPTGAMMDYEGKFYLPFKGFSKPIYAIPGNHDWYDALEGFAANFFEPDAAHASMLARIIRDNRLTTTTESRVDKLVREAARLRKNFNVSVGHQRGPFFELSTDSFALIAVDTGVMKTMDSDQWKWFQSSLEGAEGKFKFVILGHPLYAGGRYQGGDEGLFAGEWAEKNMPANIQMLVRQDVRPFAIIHRLLREHHVEVVMAGDTHYFEHYQEDYDHNGKAHEMHHFVNGGGGAYISIGTPLDWPRQPDVLNCHFFPRRDFLVAKLDAEMPLWKSPLWFWAKRMGGWPFSAEALAGAFDYNRAPYLQSFVEVRVEQSAGQVRLILHGANGPVRWQEVQSFGTALPPKAAGRDFVEFIIPMMRN